MRGRILVVDDEPQMLVAMDTTLRRNGWSVTTAASGDEALARMSEGEFSAVITDLRMPQRDGLALLEAIKARRADVPVVLMTAYGTIPSAVQAMRQGAADYLVKPFDARDVERVLDRIVPRSPGPVSETLVTASEAVRRVVALARKAARSSATILVEGESGTGKEVLARLVHRTSPRAAKPFVAVNCAAIPESLLESELFGHEKGAFTGALVRRQGKFELASGGTLLLDEIGEMPLALQAKLLRVLQERSIDRVGGTEPIPVDLRVVATTNVDLAEAVAKGRFREDLFYRLNVVRLRLPPLRERPEDVPLLAEHFCRELGGGRRRLSEAALVRLQAHRWPGNVRELRNVIERALTLASGDTVGPDDLFPDPGPPPSSASAAEGTGTVASMERDLILRTLAETGGNRTRAAEKLGISIRTLRNKLAQYRREGIEV